MVMLIMLMARHTTLLSRIRNRTHQIHMIRYQTDDPGDQGPCICYDCRPDIYKRNTKPIIELALASTEP